MTNVTGYRLGKNDPDAWLCSAGDGGRMTSAFRQFQTYPVILQRFYFLHL